MKNKRKPRILFVATLPPPIHGSAVVSQQIKESKLINDTFDGEWINLSTSRKMDEIGKNTPINLCKKLFRFISSLFRTLWLLIIHRYDMCYLAITCHGDGFIKDSPYALLCKLFCKKIIIHQHNKGMSNDVDNWPYRWLLPLVYKNAKVILLSWYLYPDIERVVPKENVLICPNGIKIPSTVKRNKEKHVVPRLLFLSNLVETKGVIVLLDALKILADKGISFQCDFVGGESRKIDASRFAEEVDKRQLNRIVFYSGRKYGEEKEMILDQSDVFVFPSMEDCFPLVILEAMSHSLPIVTTAEGAIPDEVTDGVNGFISERGNAVSLADCIEKMMADPDLRMRLGEKGYETLQEKFSDKVFLSRMREVLLDGLGGGNFE